MTRIVEDCQTALRFLLEAVQGGDDQRIDAEIQNVLIPVIEAIASGDQAGLARSAELSVGIQGQAMTTLIIGTPTVARLKMLHAVILMGVRQAAFSAAALAIAV